MARKAAGPELGLMANANRCYELPQARAEYACARAAEYRQAEDAAGPAGLWLPARTGIAPGCRAAGSLRHRLADARDAARLVGSRRGNRRAGGHGRREFH